MPSTRLWLPAEPKGRPTSPGFLMKPHVIRSLICFPFRVRENCTAGARRIAEHLSHRFILTFDRFSKKKKEGKQG